ncbi:hypothetical protein E9993_22855, partial [Labilibacter sediminis]
SNDYCLMRMLNPTTRKRWQALKAAERKEAMDNEIQSMNDNQVWNMVDRAPSFGSVGHNWIFKMKINMDVNEHTIKAGLVLRGCSQTQGIEYEETFSPVAEI